MASMLGPYEIRGELGRGAMAVVWRGFDTRLEREVAIKEPVIPAGTDSAAAAELAARFVREGQAAAKLNHPGIVTIHAAEVFDGRAAIVMEVIEGETLSTLLDRGPLGAGAAYSILDQLLDAVGYAHSKSVIHRDIKPDNVFVTHDGRVKLADFGIAHTGSSSTLTQAGTVMGTPGYMAPEQVTGGSVDARSDIFAIGVVGFEMFSGHNPFGATDGIAPTTIMYRIVHEPAPTLPPSLFVGLPADLALVLSTALSKDPADRFADTAAFRSSLAGGPIVTSRQSGGTPAETAGGIVKPWTPVDGQPPKQNWTPYLLVAGAGVLLLGGFFMFGGGSAVSGTMPSAPTSAPAAEQESIPAAGTSAGTPAAHDITYLARASASSTLPSAAGWNYKPRNLFDGDNETCWAEDAKGYGAGEYVDIDFGETVFVSDIRVLPGYDKNPGDFDRWVTNGKLREAEFVFSNGESHVYEFENSRSMQSIELETPIKTSSVRMYIRSSYKAKKSGDHKGTADTSISEMEIDGWTQSEQ